MKKSEFKKLQQQASSLVPSVNSVIAQTVAGTIRDDAAFRRVRRGGKRSTTIIPRWG